MRSRNSLSRALARHWLSRRRWSIAWAAIWPIAVMAKTGIASFADHSSIGVLRLQAGSSAIARAPMTAMIAAASVARREPDTTASRGIATSQIAAAEAAPPVMAAMDTTTPASPAEERAWAIQRMPVRDRIAAAQTGSSRLAIATASMLVGTPRHRR